jgi:hypothetical protein
VKQTAQLRFSARDERHAPHCVSIGGGIGLRLGPVTINLPVYLDFLPVDGQTITVTTFSLTTGVAF